MSLDPMFPMAYTPMSLMNLDPRLADVLPFCVSVILRVQNYKNLCKSNTIKHDLMVEVPSILSKLFGFLSALSTIVCNFAR